MNCLTRIRQRYPTFAHNDQRLAQYLLEHPANPLQLNSQQLATAAGVSQSSVVKFAQKLGYKGYPALKLALSEALASMTHPGVPPVHNAISENDPLRIVGEKLIKENLSAMSASLNINSEAKLQEGVTMIRKARRILLAGIGSAGLVAKNFSWKLMKIGIDAVAEQDIHAQLTTVQAMGKEDLLLVISYSGERRELNLAVTEALRNGISILAITGFHPNTLQQQATHSLYTIAEEHATLSTAMSSTSAQMMLTDLLFMALIQQDQSRAPEHIYHSEELVKKLQ